MTLIALNCGIGSLDNPVYLSSMLMIVSNASIVSSFCMSLGIPWVEMVFNHI